jgi:formate hydrogenlyase subunit 3/multisubunit Na+/H+ antiporter MnhD subunit
MFRPEGVVVDGRVAAQTAEPPVHPLLRVVCTVVAVVLGGAALLAGFVASILATGCLTKCEPADTEPAVVQGLVVFGLAALAWTAGSTLAAVAWRGRESDARLGVRWAVPVIAVGMVAAAVHSWTLR